MPPTIPTYVPDTLPAGVDWRWRQSFGDFAPADVSALVYYFSGVASFSVPATVGSDGFTVAVAAQTTGAYTAGTYRWTAIATVSGMDFVADSGVMAVTANPKAAGDASTFASKMVAAIEAELLVRVPGDGSGHESYVIGGTGSRSLAKIPTEKLEGMLARYQAQVEMELHGGVLPPYEVRFVRAV